MRSYSQVLGIRTSTCLQCGNSTMYNVSRQREMYCFNAHILICIYIQLTPGGSVGKESACNAGDIGDSGLIPRLGRSPGGGNSNPLQYSCLQNSMDRGAFCDMGSQRRSPRGGNGNLLQYSCLENPMERGAFVTQGHKELDMTEHASTHTVNPEQQGNLQVPDVYIKSKIDFD